jgi:hypothetical protein
MEFLLNKEEPTTPPGGDATMHLHAQPPAASQSGNTINATVRPCRLLPHLPSSAAEIVPFLGQSEHISTSNRRR